MSPAKKPIVLRSRPNQNRIPNLKINRPRSCQRFVWRFAQTAPRSIASITMRTAAATDTSESAQDPAPVAAAPAPKSPAPINAPAEPDSMKATALPNYGRLQGRSGGMTGPAMAGTKVGDTFLWTRRSHKAPNRFSQTIRNLEPGRRYSLRATRGREPGDSSGVW